MTGAAAAAFTDVRALNAAGARAWLGSAGGGALERACAEAGVPFVGGFRLAAGIGRATGFRGDARRLRELVRELDLHVVHVHRSADQLMAHLALKRGPGIRLVRTWHRQPAAASRSLLWTMARSCAAHVCVALVHAEALDEAGAEVAEYLPPGVDTEQFRPRDPSPYPLPQGARENDATPGGPLLLGARENNGTLRPAAPSARAQEAEAGAAGEAPLVLGQIGRWKERLDRGQRAFLDAIGFLDKSLNWRAVLLGRGEGRARLEGLVAAHPAGERLRLEESGAEFPAQVAALDLGLVFSTGSDGTSRPAVEMLSCGVPILVADLPGLRELADDEDCVLLLPPGQPAAWAAACGRLLSDRARLARMKSAARAQAEKVHALAVRGWSLVEFYGSL